MFPGRFQLTLVTISFSPKSHSLVTLLEAADQRYTQELNPTESTFYEDQSIKFK